MHTKPAAKTPLEISDEAITELKAAKDTLEKENADLQYDVVDMTLKHTEALREKLKLEDHIV